MLKKIFLIMLFSFNLLFADFYTIFSPGLKLGYIFGKNGGFTLGVELSIMHGPSSFSPNNYYGAVISLEDVKSEGRFHIGVQMNFPVKNVIGLGGIEIGPTFTWNKKENKNGISATAYWGLFIIPYYRLSVFSNSDIAHEAGSFLKLHLPLEGKFSVGG